MQQYTGSDVGMGGPGGARPELPDGEMPDGEMPDGSQRPELPDGAMPDGSQRPEPPNGEMPDGSQRPEPPTSEMPGTNGGNFASTVFHMTDKVNAFSGVADYTANTNNGVDRIFTDIAASAWYANDVTNVVNKGWMNGMSDTTFGPNMNLTRAMMATILYRMAGSPDVTGDTTFSDVSSDQYYAKAVTWAVEQGIIKGYEDGTFRPDANTTRAMIVTVLYRMTGSPEITEASSFSDVSSTEYYTVATVWAAKQGIVFGYQDGTFKPDANITRAETAAILSRYTAIQK